MSPAVFGDSDEIFENINTTDHLEYAPSVSSDGRHLFFTRAIKTIGSTRFPPDTFDLTMRIYVSTKSNPMDLVWPEPTEIPIQGRCVEGPSISEDGQKLYFHKFDPARGGFRIFMMTRILELRRLPERLPCGRVSA